MYQPFNLILLVEKLATGNEIGKISCIEAYENYLYVGFESGFLLQLELTLSWASEKTPAILDELNRVHASNKPLKKLMVFEGILLSWDGDSMNAYNLSTLQKENSLSLRWLNELCADDLDVESAELCAFKRKSLSLYRLNVSLKKWILLKEITLPGIVVSACRMGKQICIATEEMYYLIDIETGRNSELFPHESGKNPLICSINGSEFLLSKKSSDSVIGIFVTAAGVATRGTLIWKTPPIAVGYVSPHIISIHENNIINIYNVTDQEKVQTMPLSDETCLISKPNIFRVFGFRCFILNNENNENTDKYVCSDLITDGMNIFTLDMNSLDDQVRSLVEVRKIDAAVNLLEYYIANSGDGIANFHEQYEYIAWSYIVALHEMEKGVEIFKMIDYDPVNSHFLYKERLPRDIISKIPGSMIKKKLIYPDFHALFEQREVFKEFGRLFTEYCFDFRDAHHEYHWKKILNTIILLIYSDCENSEGIISFLETEPEVIYNVCQEKFSENNQHFPLSLIYQQSNRTKEARIIWRKLLSKEIRDSSFPGVDHYVTYIVNYIVDLNEFFEEAKWLIVNEHVIATTVFKDTQFRDQDIFPLLERLDFNALVDFLEHKIFVLGSTDFYVNHKMEEICRKMLSMLDNESPSLQGRIIRDYQRYLMDNMNIVTFEGYIHSRMGNCTKKLNKYLKYRIIYLKHISLSSIYGDISSIYLPEKYYAERVKLMIERGDMAQALELAVNELWDFALAEQIALKFLNSKQDVLKHLLDLYLKHPEPELRVFFVASILDRFTSQFKVTEVLEKIPKYWPLASLSNYLKKALLAIHQREQEAKVEKNLYRTCHVNLSSKLINLQEKESVLMENIQICVICEQFIDPTDSFVGIVAEETQVLVHKTCYDSKELKKIQI